MELGKWMDISEEIQNSIKENGPVVALESTIISHGMPFPQNLETALEVESIIRKEGAIPATIAVVEGRIKIGLSNLELEQFAQGTKTVKVSSRDLPLCSFAKTGRWNHCCCYNDMCQSGWYFNICYRVKTIFFIRLII